MLAEGVHNNVFVARLPHAIVMDVPIQVGPSSLRACSPSNNSANLVSISVSLHPSASPIEEGAGDTVESASWLEATSATLSELG